MSSLSAEIAFLRSNYADRGMIAAVTAAGGLVPFLASTQYADWILWLDDKLDLIESKNLRRFAVEIAREVIGELKSDYAAPAHLAITAAEEFAAGTISEVQLRRANLDAQNAHRLDTLRTRWNQATSALFGVAVNCSRLNAREAALETLRSRIHHSTAGLPYFEDAREENAAAVAKVRAGAADKLRALVGVDYFKLRIAAVTCRRAA